MMNREVKELSPPPGLAAPFAGECRYLISLDFDGTLLCEETHRIPPAFFEMMQQWRAYGVRWGINTGRTLPYLCGELLPTAPFLPDFICTCERYAYVAQEDGALHPLREHNARCLAHNMQVRELVRPLLHEQLRALRSASPELQWIVAPTDPLSVEAADSATMDSIMDFLNPFVAGLEGVSAQRAGRYMRLADARYCKGTALQTVAQLWQVSSHRWAMLGDGHNDMHAFRLFPEAFCGAPATAHPEVLAYLRSRGAYVSSCAGVMEILEVWRASIMTEQG